jgi:crotonobetainyl-CoA:carnitine CoA-transferase CaiB-like acyl-CoA transferase
VKGEAPNYRCYQAADRWFFFAMKSDAYDRLVQSELIAGLAGVPADQQELVLEEAFSQHPASFWNEALKDFDAAVQPLGTLSAVRRATICRPVDQNTIVFRHVENHPSGRAVQHVEPTAVRPLHAPIVRTASFEKYGASTADLMRELGFSETEITELAERGVIAHKWTDQYLPD